MKKKGFDLAESSRVRPIMVRKSQCREHGVVDDITSMVRKQH